MTTQIKPSVTTPTVSDLYEWIRADKINLRPDFQRKFVWTQEHQEAFIDTVLQGYPFPEIYVCQDNIDIDRMRTTQSVIDGQQRLTTLVNYIEGNFHRPLKSIISFENLDNTQKATFLSYQVVVRNIGQVEEGIVREIFRRINLTKFKLEDVEIHNAVYDGEFIRTAKSIVNEANLQEFAVFLESEFTRMADLYFILQVMSTLEHGGYYNRETEVEKYIEKYNEEYPQSTSMQDTIKGALLVIKDLSLGADSIWFRKSNFFTLVVEISKANKIPSDLSERLLAMEAKVLANKDNRENEFGSYYNYMYQGTNNRKARVTRSEVFQRNILQD